MTSKMEIDFVQMKHSLTQRKDLPFLKASIARANLFRENVNFPSEILTILEEAKSYFDKEIQWMKAVHRIIHTGDLAAISVGCGAIEEYIAKGGLYWYNQTLGDRFIPCVDALHEALSFWEAYSRSKIESILKDNSSITPDLELLSLRYLLAQPLYETYRLQLEERRQRIEQLNMPHPLSTAI